MSMESTALRRPICADDLFEYAKTLEGRVLQTLHDKRDFTVRLDDDSVVFEPRPSVAVVAQCKKELQAFCDRFTETLTFVSTDYPGSTIDPSLPLALLALWIVEVLPSQETKDRVADLIYRGKTSGLSSDEKAELDHFVEVEHVMRIAQVQARSLLSRE
jgi:hypothetical protein